MAINLRSVFLIALGCFSQQYMAQAALAFLFRKEHHAHTGPQGRTQGIGCATDAPLRNSYVYQFAFKKRIQCLCSPVMVGL